jgi:4-amino-4-deoxy-L-arabinose transferase-like glycosyltransferase
MIFSMNKLKGITPYAGLILFTFFVQFSLSLTGFFVGEGDLQFLHSIATQVAEGTLRKPNMYVAAFPSTLTYPAAVAVFMRLFGTTSPWVFVLINHFILCAVVSAAYGFLKNRMSQKLALAGALLIALHPFMVIYSNTSNAELVFGGLVLLSFFAFAKAQKCLDEHNRPIFLYIWVGVSALLAGFAGWARPLALLMVLAYAVYIVFFSRSNRMQRVIIVGIYLGIYLSSAQLGGMPVRHYTGYAPASSAYSFGWNLFVGASEAGTWNDEDAARFNEIMREADSPNEIHRYFAHRGLERYRDMGASIIPHTLRKLRVWNAHAYIASFYEGTAQNAVRVITKVYDLTVFLLAIAGGVYLAVKGFRKRFDILYVLLFYLAGSVFALMFLEIAPRYVVSYRMIFCILAVKIVEILQNLHRYSNNGILKGIK